MGGSPDAGAGADAAQPAERRPLPTVSVVVPCYNYGRYLRDCVASVLDQADVEVRVLIVDDASTDDSPRIAAQLAAMDRRVELRRHSANRGHIDSYNEGLAWVTGAYCAVLDADDRLAPGALRRACALLDAHPEVGFAYGDVLVFGDEGPCAPSVDVRAEWMIRPGLEWFEQRCRTTENCIYSPEVVMRSRLLRAVGGFRAELPHSGDFELWMRLALYADVGYIAGPHQACYRVHAASMHRQYYATELADLTQVAEAFRLLFRDHGDAIAERARFEELVRRTLATRAIRAACRAYDEYGRDASEAIGLEALAVTTHPDIHTVAEMRGLRWRKHLGLRLWRDLRPLLLAAQRVQRAVRRRLPRGAQ